jgi:hypothetical protein
VFTIELTRGPNWRAPVEIVDDRACATESIEAAAAEAWHWLTETQRNLPTRGASHYRVVGEHEVLCGGPPDDAG